MLYKAGASGRSLGAIDKFGTPQLNALLASAAEEFGQLMQSYRRILVTEGVRRQRFELAI